MALRPGKLAACFLVICFLANATFAQSTSPKNPAQGIPITLPSGLVIVVGGPPSATVKPDVVVLTAAQYRELQDRLERLQAQVDAAPFVRPRSCELEGRLEQRGRQAVVRLKATFKYVTTRPNTVVFLGCQRAHVVEAATGDGKAPLLTAREDGLRVEVESAGEHSLRLDLDLPVTSRGPQGSDLGFEFGLPGAPITALSFEPPAQVRRYSLTTRSPKAGGAASDPEVEQAEVERFQPGKGGSPLGPITSLALSWEDPARRAAVARSAEVDVTATVGPDDLLTEARIRLRGPNREWRFTAPATADVAVGLWPGGQPGKGPLSLPAERVPDVIRPEAGQSVWRVEFRDSFVADLLVTITSRTLRGRPGEAGPIKPLSVGPFAVLDVPQQSGLIRLRSPAAWKATVTTKGDVRREGDDDSNEAIYRVRYATLKAAPTDAPISFTLTQLPGSIQARTRHELRLTETAWRLRSEVSLAPSRVAVEHIDFDCPAGFQPAVAEPGELVESFNRVGDSTSGRQIFRAVLSSPKRSSFSFTIEGDYALGPNSSSATVRLPRPTGVSERASELIVIAPARFDVRAAFRVWELTKSGTWDTPLDADPAEGFARLHGSADRSIDSVELNWRVAAAGAVVRSVADVEISSDRLRVIQHLSYRFTGRLPARLHLKGDRDLQSVRSSRGPIEQVAGGWDLVVPADGLREQQFVVTYFVPVDGSSPTDPVLPLLIPIDADTQHVVRVWPALDSHVELIANEGWQSAPIEIVDDRPSLPRIVARGRGESRGPQVRILPNLATSASSSFIERVRFDVRIAEGFTAYRARYWVREATNGISFALPGDARDVELLVQGKRVPPDGRAHAVEGPTQIHVPRLAWTGKAASIELRYRLAGSFSGRLEPPDTTSLGALGDVSWSITAPPGAVALVSGDVAGAWAPSKLLAAFGIVPSGFSVGGEPGSENEIGLRQAQPGPITFVVVPRIAWILLCSVVALGVGILLAFSSARWRVVLATVGLVLVLSAAFKLPQPTAQMIAGFTPGLLVLALAALVWRLARTRYHRRRAARLPAFARPGSSLARHSALQPRDVTLREGIPKASPSALTSGA